MPLLVGLTVKRPVWLLLMTLLAVCPPVPPAAAAPVAVTENVTAEVIPEVIAAAPGDRFWLALRLTIREGWHLYWTNPGDSGLPPVAAWTTPPDVAVGPLQFPVPQSIPVGPLTNYGFKDEVILLAPVDVAASVPPGTPIHLEASAEWLVCEEICIPEFAELDLSVPVQAGAAQPDASAATVFAQARAHMPQPAPASWAPRFAVDDGTVILELALPDAFAAAVEQLTFFPAEPGAIVHSAPQRRVQQNGTVSLVLEGDFLAQEGNLTSLDGVLTVSGTAAPGPSKPAWTGYWLVPKPADPGTLAAAALGTGGAAPEAPYGSGDARPAAPSAGAQADPSMPVHADAAPAWRIDAATAVLFALLGGLLLNLMPCVFPVLFLKALGMVESARHDAWRVRRHGLVFTAGVLASFLALAGGLIALKAAGAGVGWGFQLQSPAVVSALAFLFFAIGLSLTGVFSLGAGLSNVGSSLAAQSGYAGSFFTGVLACIVATPCTAPFMGAAVGFALGTSGPVALAVFAALGFGMALPYLLLSCAPGLLRRLPRPGPWMERFKQFLAFPMYITAAWLVWVLSQQTGPSGVATVLAGAILIGFVAWVHGLTRSGSPVQRGFGTAVVLVGLLGLAGLAGLTQTSLRGAAEAAASGAASEGAAGAGPRWTAYSAPRLAELRAADRPVFVNLTAAWCITCLVNERVALSSGGVGEAFRRRDIAYLKGDWTSYDPEITKLLESFGRSGVPLYILYPADGGAPRVLPQILTEGDVLAAIETL